MMNGRVIATLCLCLLCLAYHVSGEVLQIASPSSLVPRQVIRPYLDALTWTRATSAAAWVPQYVHNNGLFYDNKIWKICGRAAGNVYNSEVWCSADSGVNWTQATAQSMGTAARHGGFALSFKNKMWYLGGLDVPPSGRDNDVWYSTDGTNWTEATSDAGWSARPYMSAWVFDDKMWIFGGIGATGYSTLGDVWYSTNGISWTRATADAGFYKSQAGSCVFNNKMWIVGGYNTLLSGTNSVHSSSDGVSWATDTLAAAWTPTVGQSIAVVGDQMWMLGAFTASRWNSIDGINWSEVTGGTGYISRGMTGLAQNGSKVWIYGGYTTALANDVWYSDIFLHSIGYASASNLRAP